MAWMTSLTASEQRRESEIKQLMVLLAGIWQAYPELRLCQLIQSALGSSGDPYGVLDATLRDRLLEFAAGARRRL